MHPYSNGVPEGFSSWDDWRRWTVTEFVKTLQDSIKSVKPWVKLSTAALGKYNWDGWQAYGTVFQDAALWFNEGYVDQLMPMHYHWTNASEFYSMLVGPNGDSDYIRCWGKYIQKGIEDGRLYTVGPGSYQLHAKNVWDNHESIVKKMREIEWVDGLQFFSYSNWVTHNYWGVANELFFPTPTKIKATVGEDTLAPETPVISITKLDSMVYRISIEESSFGEEPSRFIIYRSKDSTLTPESSNIAYIKYTNSGFHYNDYIKEQKGGYYYYGVTTADRYWNESELSNIVRTEELPHESVVPVPPILEYVRKLDSGYEVKWAHSGVNDCRGYRLYARAMDTNWYLLLDENTLDVGTTHAIVNTEIEEVPWFFSIRAVGLGPAGYESEDSDIYGAYISDTDRVLVIDAFDRTTGEWSQGTHPFAMKVCESLSRANISYDCGTDEAFEHKDILSDEYKAIFWLCGDAAGQDEVVGFNSMSYLANYLSKGGQLLISGSEIAYDMDYRGSYQDKKFIHEVLKVNYVSNGENGNGYKVDGTDQGIFSGLSFNFDDGTGGFRILKPDVIDTTNGSVPCFKYSNRNEIAGVQYQGTISNGQEDARIITLGFPFESIYVEEQLDQFVSRVLEYFNITEEIGISAPVERVEDFSLCRNYPNPFNSSTIIQFSLPEAATVKLEIFNVKGQRVYEQSYAFSLSGVKNITWDANDLSSGVYHYRISQLNGNQQLLHHGKMLYMK